MHMKIKQIPVNQLKSIFHNNDVKELQTYECRCTDIDMYYAIKPFLNMDKIHFNKYPYSWFNMDGLTNEDLSDGELQISEPSMYGDVKYIFYYNNIIIQFVCSNKRKLNFTNFNSIEYKYDINNVYLDIETTGLNLLTDEIFTIAFYQPATNKKMYIMCNFERHNQFRINELLCEKYYGEKKSRDISEYEFNEIMLKEDVSKNIIDNRITLTQEYLYFIIDMFNLSNNNLVVWTGSNLFDVKFLDKYLYDHDIILHTPLNVMNARDCIDKDLSVDSRSKDSIAMRLKIDITKSHSALGDCIIQSEICKKIAENNIPKILNIHETIHNISKNYTTIMIDEARAIYNDICDYCIQVYGFVDRDYDDNPRKRGKELIDIHHVDETILDDIATRTTDALQNNDVAQLKQLKPYNKRDRLVYAPHPIHFILHVLIEKIRQSRCGGPHWLWYTMMKNNEINYYNEDLLNIYCQVCRNINNVDQFYRFGGDIELAQETKLLIQKTLKKS